MPDTDHGPWRVMPAQPLTTLEGDVGGVLRQARLKKGLSLDTISHETRIGKRYLEALEHNRFEDFPAPAYLRAFLKSYCDYLGVDFTALWKQEKKSEEPAQAQPGARPAADSRPLAGLAALGAAAGLLIWTFSRRHAAEPPRPLELPAALAPVTSPPPPELSIVVRRDVWLSVSVDGATRFEGRAPRGARQQWIAQKTITLRATDPDAIQATLNGSPVKALSQPLP
ncbi:MAG: helix-turn-helix domain-containing protein [Elusimicrobia bacterium]|nr:helix-turn-helix domain-containing protein [Elusimicrobiota bacterium]